MFRGNVPPKTFYMIPPWHCWVFHLRLVWDVMGTYVTYSWDVVETFYRWRRSTETLLGSFHLGGLLRQTENHSHDFVMTSSCRVSILSHLSTPPPPPLPFTHRKNKEIWPNQYQNDLNLSLKESNQIFQVVINTQP